MAIVFGPKIHIFVPKIGKNSDFIPKSAYGGEGPPVKELFLEKK